MSLQWIRTNAQTFYDRKSRHMSARRCFVAERVGGPPPAVVMWVFSSRDRRGWWVCTHAPNTDFLGPYDRLRNAMFVAENTRSFLKEEA